MRKLSTPRTTWIDMVTPTLEDVETLRTIYPFIHPLNLEDVFSAIERPKIDDHDEYLFLVLHFPLWDGAKRLSRPSEVNIFVGKGFVVTVHDGKLKPLMRLFDSCAENPEALQRLLGRGAGHAFYEVVDKLVDYIFPILRKVDSNIRSIEEIVFTGNARDVIREISLVRRDIIALRRIIRQQVPILENLEKRERPMLHEDLEEYFGDLLDHLYRARDIVDENSEVIVSLAETADTLINNRVNEVIRILTVISVIMLPLTLISSVYGMNVGLPLQDHPYAFVFVNVMMVFIAVGMLVYFRTRGWL
jgi:magnesium transporter